MTFWDIFFPVERGICMAAFIGTTVFLLQGKKKDRATIVTVVITNYLTAVYLTALFAEMSSLKSLEGIAFAIGVGGFKLIERVMNQVFNKIDRLKSEDDGGNNSTTE